jgi:hypothetical protein
MIDSDHDGYITQGDLLRTFGMHLDERAMERMLEKIDWRANRMNFEEFQLMLSDNRKSDDERGVLEYTKALQYIAEKGAFAAKKAAAEKTTASEKAAAEKEAAEDEAAKKEAAAKAAAEKEAAEKAAAEKAVDAPVDFATPQVKVEMEEALNTPSSAAPTPRTPDDGPSPEWLREASKALAAEKEAAERVAAHTAPVGRPPAPEGEDELFEMTVPEGVMPGDMLQATTPSGVKVRLMVPEGVSPGAVLTFKADAISPSKWAMQSPLREPPAAPAGATTGLATPAAPAEATTDLATPAAPHALLQTAQTDQASPSTACETEHEAPSTACETEHKAPSTACETEHAPSTACETEHEAAKAEPATKAEIAAAMATLTSMANSLLMHAKFEAAKAEAVVKRQRAAVLAAAAAAEIETTLTSMTFELLGHAKSDAAAKAAALAMARAAIHNGRTPTAPGLSTVVAATSSPVKHARHNARHMTTAQLRAALRESGVDAPEGADRETLEALVTLSTDATAAATELSPPHASVRLVRSPPAGRPAAAANAPSAAAAAAVTTAASAESAAAAATRPDRSSICILSHDPMVYVIDRFFTPDECEMIKDAAATHHKYPSRVKQPMTGLAARQQPGQMSDGRRSETTWLHYSDAVSAPEGP